MLYLERRDTIETLDYSGLPQQLDKEILSKTISLASSVTLQPCHREGETNADRCRQVNWKNVKHEVLQPSEMPTPGTVVAIDAEFVSLQQV